MLSCPSVAVPFVSQVEGPRAAREGQGGAVEAAGGAEERVGAAQSRQSVGTGRTVQASKDVSNSPLTPITTTAAASQEMAEDGERRRERDGCSAHCRCAAAFRLSLLLPLVPRVRSHVPSSYSLAVLILRPCMRNGARFHSSSTSSLVADSTLSHVCLVVVLVGCSKVIRKSIARVLTVYNQNERVSSNTTTRSTPPHCNRASSPTHPLTRLSHLRLLLLIGQPPQGVPHPQVPAAGPASEEDQGHPSSPDTHTGQEEVAQAAEEGGLLPHTKVRAQGAVNRVIMKQRTRPW